MNPNYNFDNEISEQYGLAAREFRIIATDLMNTFKVISKKEYDVIMWQACNLTAGSLLRIELLKTLKKLQTVQYQKRVVSKQQSINF